MFTSIARTARLVLVSSLLLTGLTAQIATVSASSGARSASATPGCGQSWTPGKDYNGNITSGGVQRTYMLHVPSGYVATHADPLIFNLEGTGMDAQAQEQLTHMSSTADQQNVLVVYPNSQGSDWNVFTSSDVTFLDDLVSALEKQLCVDTTRIGVAGYSLGAEMAYHLACSNTPWVASIEPVAGMMPVGQFQCKLAHPTALQAFNGMLDPIVNYNGWGRAPTIPQGVAGWAAAVGCPSTVRTLFNQGDVVETGYVPCSTGSDTELYTITDGGHTWPGGKPLPWLGNTTNVIDASSLIGTFVASHPLQ